MFHLGNGTFSGRFDYKSLTVFFFLLFCYKKQVCKTRTMALQYNVGKATVIYACRENMAYDIFIQHLVENLGGTPSSM